MIIKEDWWDEYRKLEEKMSKDIDIMCTKIIAERRKPVEYSRLNIKFGNYNKIKILACA